MLRFTTLSEHEAGETTLIIQLRNKILLLDRDGKETFFIPDTSQTLCFVDKMVPVASLNVNIFLRLNEKKEIKIAILSMFNSPLDGKYFKVFYSSSDIRLK